MPIDIPLETFTDLGGYVPVQIRRMAGLSFNLSNYSGADPTGATDSSAAFSRMWVDVKAAVTADQYVPIRVTIPAGTYAIGTSINWTGGASTFLAWNVFIDGEGAILKGSCAGKAIIDMTGVRGMHLRGLSFVGSTSSIPSCGLLVGARATDTCGNGQFTNLKFVGYYSKACVGNIAIETSTWRDCYFINSNPDTAPYAYAGDGAMNLGFTSDYSTLRSAGTVNSLTNNSFSGCRFQRSTAGGHGIYLERTINWTFHRDNYYLSWAGACFYILQGASTTNRNLRIEGLFETNQAPGLEYCVLIAQPDTETSNLRDLYLDVGLPLMKTATIGVKRTSDLGNLTSGAANLINCHIRQNGSTQGPNTAPMFSGTFINFSGEIHSSYATNLNLATLNEFHGLVQVDDMTGGTLPGGNSTGVILERGTRNMRMIGLQNFANDAAAATGSIVVGGLYRNGSAVQVRVS